MVIFAGFVSQCSSNDAEPVHVSVKNDISEGVELHIHCKSKDTDFGDHTLSYGAEFAWKFRINILFSTLYWCNMSWADHVDGKYVYVQGSYDIYNAKRDWDKCENKCHFSVRKDCIYGYDKAKGALECVYRWPN
ncbi:hypothetical protein MKW94_025467 [Papaver nudicaule]|uniref:S-protein homolog n=1 Tax=Papaver nudicaule TaxID=74823 RepID=A0AA41RY08_PAPNU|nr:hypothetical protein [Papaver nudicaule]